MPVLGHRVAVEPGAQVGRQQRTQQAQRELAGLDAFLALGVFVDHRIHAGTIIDAAGLAEGHVLAGHVLQLDRDVLHDVTEPGALVFLHAPDQPARRAVRAAVFVQTGHRLDQGIDEAGAEAPGRPGFQRPEIQLQPDHREMRIERGADEYRTIENAHGRT